MGTRGAYRGIEKGWGRDLKNAVTTATRPVGPSLRRDGGENFEKSTLLDAFSGHFYT